MRGPWQVCLDGKWVELRGNGMRASDLDANQLRFNVGAQAEVASAVFAVRAGGWWRSPTAALATCAAALACG